MPTVFADRRAPAEKPAAAVLVADGQRVDAVFDVPVGPELMGADVDAIVAEVVMASPSCPLRPRVDSTSAMGNVPSNLLNVDDRRLQGPVRDGMMDHRPEMWNAGPMNR
jgi:hypothetical protein